MAKADKAAKKSDKPIVDVAQPDKSAPSDSAKPIIVTNRPIIKDPMVNEDKQGGEQPLSKNRGVKIQPLTAPELKADKAAAKSTEPVDDSEIEAPTIEKLKARHKQATAEPKPTTEKAPEPEPKPEPKTEATPEPKTEAKAEAEPAESDKPPAETSTKETTKQTATPKQAQQLAEAEQVKHDEQVERLATSKQYYLPINSVEKRRSKRLVALGFCLAIVLALAWVDIALDAGLISLPVQPLTHFFST